MNIDIKKENWFPTNVFHLQINEDFCDTLEKKVLVDKDKWKKNLANVKALTSGWDGLKEYEELRSLCDYICQSILTEIGKNENWKYNNWITNDAWINFYQKNDLTKLHTHGFADFCGVLIIKPGNGNLCFSKTELVESKTRPFEFVEDQQINEKKGSLILFPSWLYHSVSNCENDRITASFNFSNQVND